MYFNDSITKLKGIGEKTALLYEKLGVFTIGDLLQYYPRSYERFEETVTISDTAEMDFAAVRVVICSMPTIKHIRNLAIVSTKVKDERGDEIRVTWYQMIYLAKTLRPGGWYILRGRLEGTGKSRHFEQPQVYSLEKYQKLRSSLQPVYALTAGLTSQSISKAVAQAYRENITWPQILSGEIRQKYHLMEENLAGYYMHFPENQTIFFQARRTIVFQEFYRFLSGVKQLKASLEQEKNHFALVKRDEVHELIRQLPYRLTGAQLRTFEEIESDMTGHHMMHRMVQGDVGSGKTIVAFLAMYEAALCRYQSALMVPTEVLAVQHYNSFCKLSETYQLKLRIVLLTGSLKAAQRREAYEQIESGEADIVIGTHALIQDKVIFHELALVITDEQHRFGVRQRDSLAAKGPTPHVLVMSATPIPRSLAIILYGDLDLSVIDELPARRLPVKNCVVGISYRQKGWDFIAGQVGKGHQAYVICPMVEESELMEGTDVVSCCRNLREYYKDKKITCEYLHGKMSPKQKEEIMQAFAENQIQVLVSTTVIEVGIDVPNATVIMIEDAQRFGLAQLHQLRGRVGRGTAQSYCIMVDTSGKEESSKRLEVLNRSNDGFEIAGEDLKLRGPGDFFGVRQSGEIAFQVADIYQDAEILKAAKEAVDQE